MSKQKWGSSMKYDIDENYPFQENENGLPLMPNGTTIDGELYVLPNGRYLPTGAYALADGSTLIYEPIELSPYADMLSQFHS